ncbi:MAG: hypothetical protein ACI8Q1_001540 [Parvicella sp.]|jgi:hypothetical protein
MLTPYLICLILSLLLNIIGFILFLSPPGLHLTLLPLFILISLALIIVSILFTKKSKYHRNISLLLLLAPILSVITLMNVSVANDKGAGLIFFSFIILTEVTSIFLAYKNKHLFE